MVSLNEDVQVESSPTTEDDRAEMLAIIEKHNPDVIEDPSSLETKTLEPDNTDSDTTEKDSDTDRPDANSRIRQLVREQKVIEDKNKRLYARTKKAEEDRVRINEELQKQSLVLKTLYKQYKEDMDRFKEASFIDPLEQENLSLRRQQEWGGVSQQLERQKAEYRRQAEEHARQVMEEERVAMEALQVVEEFDDALSTYPGVTREQLAWAMDQDYKTAVKTGVAFTAIADLAARIDEENLNRYESRVLAKNKAKVTAPRPLKNDGNFITADPELDDTESLVRHLDLKFGKDWLR